MELHFEPITSWATSLGTWTMGYLIFTYNKYICTFCKHSILHIYYTHILMYIIYAYMHIISIVNIYYLYILHIYCLYINYYYTLYSSHIHYLLFIFILFSESSFFFFPPAFCIDQYYSLSLEPWTISNKMCVCSFYELWFSWGKVNTSMHHGFIPHLFRTKMFCWPSNLSP